MCPKVIVISRGGTYKEINKNFTIASTIIRQPVRSVESVPTYLASNQCDYNTIDAIAGLPYLKKDLIHAGARRECHPLAFMEKQLKHFPLSCSHLFQDVPDKMLRTISPERKELVGPSRSGQTIGLVLKLLRRGLITASQQSIDADPIQSQPC